MAIPQTHPGKQRIVVPEMTMCRNVNEAADTPLVSQDGGGGVFAQVEGGLWKQTGHFFGFFTDQRRLNVRQTHNERRSGGSGRGSVTKGENAGTRRIGRRER